MNQKKDDHGDAYQNFLEFASAQNQIREYESRKRLNSWVLLTKQMLPYLTVIYAVVFIVFMSANYESFNFTRVLGVNSKGDISVLRSQVETLGNDLIQLEDLMATQGAALGNQAIQLRLSQLETNYKSLSDTVLYDADKALTARLLREKQVYLDDQIQYLREEQKSMKNTFMTLILTIIGTPLLTLALPLIFGTVKARVVKAVKKPRNVNK